MGRIGFVAAVEVGLDEGELVVMEIGAGWEIVGGGATGLGIGLEGGEGTVCKGRKRMRMSRGRIDRNGSKGGGRNIGT